MNQSQIIYLESGQKVAKLEGEKARPGRPRKLDLLLKPGGKWKLNGHVPRTEAQAIEDFLSRVLMGDKTQCWEWSGSVTPKGYGRVRVNSKNVSTHRLAWKLSNGPIPNGLFVCHKCDNPKCCNPDHLFLGTAKDNADDANRKGRIIKGTQRKFSKLSDDDVRQMRLKSSAMSVADLAREYEISPGNAWHIIHRNAWKHVC